MRTLGKPADADRFDNLAKVAIGKQLSFEQEARDAEPMIQSQEEVVAKLKTGLDQMKGKLDELKTKRDQLIARLDNLGKGASGAAVQNLRLMLGL